MTTLIEAATRTTVDDYLGPGDRRFFGKGYKRADQRLRDITVGRAEDGTGFVRARATVGYPEDWSRKGKTDQPPHLSSIDVLLIAGETAELYLTHALGLDAGQRSALRLRRVVIKAGRSPVEEELADFAVSAVITDTDRTCEADGHRVSAVDCQVGALRVRCEIEHPAGVRHDGPGSYADPDELLGPPGPRPYAHAHKAKSQVIEDLRTDLPGVRADALLSVRSEEEYPVAAVGLESHSHHGTSLVDAFVAGIQLGQILLYELDSVRRADSNTLWMRQTVLEIADPHRVVREPARVTTRLDGLQLITTREGDVWRSADILSDFQHVTVRCSVAHRLPAAPGEGTGHA